MFFFILGRVPHICTGNKKCYRYYPSNDTWLQSGSLKYDQHEGFTFYHDLGIVMASDDRQVESTIDGETIKVLM